MEPTTPVKFEDLKDFHVGDEIEVKMPNGVTWIGKIMQISKRTDDQFAQARIDYTVPTKSTGFLAVGYEVVSVRKHHTTIMANALKKAGF